MSDVTQQAQVEFDEAQDSGYDLASAIIDWVATPSGAAALFDAKITPDHLLTSVAPERIAREIMEWVYDFKYKHGEWPIAERTYEYFRQHYVDDDGMVLESERPGRIPISDLVERLHARKIWNDSQDVMEAWAIRGSEDVLGSLNHCISELTDISRGGSYGIEQFTPTDITGEELIEAYEQRAHDGSLTRVTSGFDLVDKQLGGGYRGLTFIQGRPGGFKSFLSMISAHHAARMGETVVVLTLELTADEYRWRHAAYATKASWNRMDNGLLTADEKTDVIMNYDDVMAAYAGVVHFVYPPPDQRTVPALKALAEQYEATVVYIDQFNLIEIPGKFNSDHERASSVCPGLKLWANELPGALIVAHQRNREADKKKKSHNFGMETAARTDAIVQYADLVMATSQLDDQRRVGAFTYGTVKARNGPSPIFDFATSMKATCDIKCVGLHGD